MSLAAGLACGTHESNVLNRTGKSRSEDAAALIEDRIRKPP
jgi:hypothetical protein